MPWHLAHAVSLLGVLTIPEARLQVHESTAWRSHAVAQVAGGWRGAPPTGGWRGAPPTPPPPPAEHVERRKGFVWVQGDYRLRDGAYFWEGGHFEKERPRRHWHPGRWEWQGNQYIWISGQWVDGATLPPPAAVVSTPPPPPIVVEAPPQPRRGFVWIPASNEWHDGRYVRVEGRWEPERADKRWEAGHWDRDGDRSAWHPGGWQQRADSDDRRRGPGRLPYMAETPDGAMEFTVTYAGPQAYVEAFVRRNGSQIAAGNIVQSAVGNADGTVTYRRVLPPSHFHPGDTVDVRFYSYGSGQPGVFIPGPTGSTWLAPMAYR